ncbi:MAG: hypothetical protein LBQ22_10705 [Bacteroidales bacterium]|jgi:ribosomal protein S3AE|nr:hypothetical protein [Bacteroidales bacterium]
MKKGILIITLFLASVGLYAQKNNVEVLYFKAELACCQATACNNLESEIKSIVEKNFPSENVTFKQVSLVNDANKALVSKYNAKSQTVVLVTTKNGKESSIDVSDIVRKYVRNENKKAFEKSMIEKIKESLN